MKYLLGALFFMIVLFPVWFPYTEVVREKTEAREAMEVSFPVEMIYGVREWQSLNQALFGELVFRVSIWKRQVYVQMVE